jgi:hypothetical protein
MSRSWDIAAELLSVAEDPALISEFAVQDTPRSAFNVRIGLADVTCTA